MRSSNPARPARYSRRASSQGTTSGSPEDVRRSHSTVSSRVSSMRSPSTVGSVTEVLAAKAAQMPFDVVEFSQRPRTPPPGTLPVDHHFKSDRALEFMASKAGEDLRRSEKLYTRTTREVLASLIRVTDSKLLILGCGASRALLPLLNMRPSSVCFVDSSQPALDRMQRLVDTGGFSSVTECEYFCCDAWDFISDEVVVGFDVVMATKCLGQVFKKDPLERNIDSFLNFLSSLLLPGGLVVVDHQRVFSSVAVPQPIAHLVPKAQYDVATIAGRYADDVSYSARTVSPDYEQLMCWTSDGRSSKPQVWDQFVYKFVGSPRKPVSPVVDHSVPPYPVEFPLGRLLDADDYADSFIPSNLRGVKAVVTPSDVGAHDLSLALPKFDGCGGVLLAEGSTALFVSKLLRFQRDLPVVVDKPICLSAELVFASPGTGVIVVNGVVCVGDVDCDPLDYKCLQALAGVVSQFAPAGIVPSSPAMLRYLTPNNTVLFSARGRPPLELPVDGINATVNGRNGVFFKPYGKCSVDLLPFEAQTCLAAAAVSIGAVDGPVVTGAYHGKGNEVHEYVMVSRHPCVWRCLRPRPDKAYPDSPGKTIVMLAAALCMADVRAQDSVQGVLNKLFR